MPRVATKSAKWLFYLRGVRCIRTCIEGAYSPAVSSSCVQYSEQGWLLLSWWRIKQERRAIGLVELDLHSNLARSHEILVIARRRLSDHVRYRKSMHAITRELARSHWFSPLRDCYGGLKYQITNYQRWET